MGALNQLEDRKEVPCVYGAVTTGHAWKFLKLEADTAYLDIETYYIKNPQKIVGRFSYMIQQFV